ncbi:DUF2637 domain-containing protein [Streptomyces iranensis]|uniref:DUF2637 domain-containing protein n=1 Tax=Streptomyces iranensis TaxID=576784 RepID=A0A061A4T9_9ACTN|nr:DUF2637 domain-containing protein [Streptomyces iranensis]MBP2059592.1 hypothetical protein [Streptomyces iranensis]CDR10484.1 predicted protein [Streptomyces iranensis]
MTHTEPLPARITGWDRAAIIALGAAGCALSYDALQQMAVAIHIRGPLTWIFPLVIDGFIGYGVRALLVMRTASLAARCYVWLLFGTATAASIWANALHAVRLNDQTGGGGLRLGDVTVGVLSTLAPLALAGAVHLYILIARRAAAQSGHPATQETSVMAGVRTERVTAGTPDTSIGGDTAWPVTGHRSPALSAGVPDRRAAIRPGPDTPGPDAPSDEPVTESEATPEHESRGTDLGGEPGARSSHPTPATPAPGPDEEPGAAESATAGEADELLPIARRAVTDAGKLTRKVVADAIRGQGRPLSNHRLTELMQQLRAEADKRTLRPTG